MSGKATKHLGNRGVHIHFDWEGCPENEINENET